MLQSLIEAGVVVGGAVLVALALFWWVYICVDKEWSFLVVISPVVVGMWLSLSAAIHYG